MNPLDLAWSILKNEDSEEAKLPHITWMNPEKKVGWLDGNINLGLDAWAANNPGGYTEEISDNWYERQGIEKPQAQEEKMTEMSRLVSQQQAAREGERAQQETLGSLDRRALDDAGGRDMIEESRRQAEEAEASAAATKQSFAERQKAIEEKYAKLLAEKKRRR